MKGVRKNIQNGSLVNRFWLEIVVGILRVSREGEYSKLLAVLPPGLTTPPLCLAAPESRC